MSNRYDPAVTVRAYRFIAGTHGFHIKRGAHMDTPTDRADRWYLIPLDASYDEETRIKAQTKGFATIKAAANAARS